MNNKLKKLLMDFVEEHLNSKKNYVLTKKERELINNIAILYSKL